MRHKGRELEIGRRRKEKERERELSWEGEKWEEREEIWTMSSLLPRKRHKQSVKM